MKISLVGGTGRRGRGTQPIEFKVEVLYLITKKGLSAKDAIASAASQFGVDIAGKSSYTEHAGSHKNRYIKEVYNACQRDPAVDQLCKEKRLEFRVDGDNTPPPPVEEPEVDELEEQEEELELDEE